MTSEYNDTSEPAQQISTAPSWRDLVKVHPAADDYPMMSDAELDALGENIKAHGLRSGIAIWIEGAEPPARRRRAAEPPTKHWLIDGRNRLEAAWRTFTDPEERDEIINAMLDGGIGDGVYGRHIAAPVILYEKRDAPLIGEDGMTTGEYGLVVDVDPYAYAESANLHRRHLDIEDRKRIAADLLRAQPERSNREVAKMAKLSRPVVGEIRGELEDAGTVAKVATIVGADGVAQPARKAKAKPAAPKPAATPAPAPMAEIAPEPQPASNTDAPAAPGPAPTPALAPVKSTMTDAETKVVGDTIRIVKRFSPAQWSAFWDWAVTRNEEMGGE